MLVGNGCGLLGLETPKSAVSQEWNGEMSWFSSCWCKFRKGKSFAKNLDFEIWAKMLSANQIYRIFKSTISLGQNDEKAWFFACWYRFMENRNWLKNIGVGVLKNECGHFFARALKLAVCQGKMNEINWFWVCWYKFMKAKSYCNNFWVVVVKIGVAFKVLEL